MSSSNHLFLLFLLLVILPLAVLLSKLIRGNSRAWAPRPIQAPRTAHETLPPTTMSEAFNPQRDENDRWKALIGESETAIKQYLVPRIHMNLDIFIRCITFRVFLVVFLGVDPNTLVFGRLEQVTTALSYFYGDAQGRNALPPDVQGILNEWLPREQFPSSLDRILPAYEALWRIVATLVVMCEDDQTKDLRWMMLDFRDNPWDRQYRSSFRADGKSVAAITDEVVGRVTPIARSQHAATSTWPLSCIQYASASGPNGWKLSNGAGGAEICGVVGVQGRWSDWAALWNIW
ncbi:hypothetical protein JVT61DRAFT_2668 [Boletus reticuloceps]|uniref:Uncharacterized protein n=1 Tax=Boletus reticuloceps TaxID=495285 RepID=A0A8I3A8J2_9AGAM|nr:hypothetical protein JVT61DRAFT_2668 [Boletus reticuloceps]